jgi:hypothetical protein
MCNREWGGGEGIGEGGGPEEEGLGGWGRGRASRLSMANTITDLEQGLVAAHGSYTPTELLRTVKPLLPI